MERISKINVSDLMSKEEVLEYLNTNGACYYEALHDIEEKYFKIFGGDIIIHCPISSGTHAGAYIVPVHEGFLLIGYDQMDKKHGPWLDMKNIRLVDEDFLNTYLEDFNHFSENFNLLVQKAIQRLGHMRSKSFRRDQAKQLIGQLEQLYLSSVDSPVATITICDKCDEVRVILKDGRLLTLLVTDYDVVSLVSQISQKISDEINSRPQMMDEHCNGWMQGDSITLTYIRAAGIQQYEVIEAEPSDANDGTYRLSFSRIDISPVFRPENAEEMVRILSQHHFKDFSALQAHYGDAAEAEMARMIFQCQEEHDTVCSFLCKEAAHAYTNSFIHTQLSAGEKEKQVFDKEPYGICYISDPGEPFEWRHCYTRADFLDAAQGDLDKAEMLFEICTWESPWTVADQFNEDDERELQERKQAKRANAPNSGGISSNQQNQLGSMN